MEGKRMEGRRERKVGGWARIKGMGGGGEEGVGGGVREG